MRVYEIAKELGVASKDVIVFLKSAGFDVVSHMSILSDDARVAIKKKFPSAEPIAQEKSEKKIEKKIEKIEKEEPVGKSNAPLPLKEDRKVGVGISEVHKQIKKTEERYPVQAQAPKTESMISAEEKKIFEKVAFGDAPEIIAEELNLDALSKGREKIDRFLVKRSFDAGAPRPFRRRSRRRRFKVIKEEAPKIVSQITIDRCLPLCEAADLMGKSSGELITILLKRGMVCNRNHILAPDIVKSLADQLGIKASIIEIAKEQDSEVAASAAKQAKAIGQEHRAPIVVVMGHVDHGKTTLLDYIRKMNVAGSEKGGITQHLGAYEVSSTHGKIVFLDTPGHEAFSYIRERGSRVTDIAVLVVAADDGIKPQTLEAIKHAKAAEVPIIVAINKIDKMQSPAAIETVKRQLAQHELMPEDWGGQTIVVPISAKTGQGVDNLLELLVLQSQLMELKANPNVPAKAFVLESKIERGHGPVATVICTEGTLKQGDFFTCGGSAGKVRLLINSRGDKITSAAPSVPVQVIGFESFNAIGDWLQVVPQDVYLKVRANREVEPIIATETGVAQAMLQLGANEKQQVLNLIIKTDTRGSREALKGCIDKLSKLSKEVKCPVFVVSSGVGDISENDIEFAESTNSTIVGLHVKLEKNAAILAKQKNVTVLVHTIIYHLAEELEKILQSKKVLEIVWNKVGEANVKKIFDIKGVGVIAGCYMRDGVIAREHKIACMRDNKKVWEGKMTSLQRDKKPVKEVHAGYEFAFMADGFNEWVEGDVVYAMAQVKEKQK